MIADPYQEQAPAALRTSLRHETAVSITRQDGSLCLLDVTSGSVTLDESWAPHAALSATVRVPDLTGIDARTRPAVLVSAGYRYGGGLRDVHPLVDLTMRSGMERLPADVYDVEAAGAEALVQDDTPVSTTLSWTSIHPARDALVQLIRSVQPGAPVEVDLPATTFVPAGETYRVAPGDPVWTALVDISDRVGAWTYHDGLTWRVTTRPVLTTPRYTVTTGATGTVITADAETSRETWHNAVVVIHEWRDEAGVDRSARGWAQVASGPLSVTSAGRRTLVVRRDTPVTTAAAILSARALLARTMTRGVRTQVTAIAAYWLRPGMTVALTLPGRAVERLLVASIRFDLVTGLMDLRLRRPEDDADITTGA